MPQPAARTTAQILQELHSTETALTRVELDFTLYVVLRVRWVQASACSKPLHSNLTACVLQVIKPYQFPALGLLCLQTPQGRLVRCPLHALLAGYTPSH